METFHFKPNWGAERSREPKVNVLKFGDGYEQVQPTGLNHNLRQYSLTFSGSEEHIRQIDQFLIRHGGYLAFLWTPHHQPQGKFRCGMWKVIESAGFHTLSAEFREVIM